MPGQGYLPTFLEDYLEIGDRVIVFDAIMKEMEIERYLKVDYAETGRPRYNPVNMMKTILFGFMDGGYSSLRELEDKCRTDLRYRYLMENEMPSYRTFGDFINEHLAGSIEEILKAINGHLFAKEGVDLDRLYIDGSKFEANANKYSWVWRKGTENSREKLYGKITQLLEKLDGDLRNYGLKLTIGTEYVPEQLAEILRRYERALRIDESTFVKGKGHHKTEEQRNCETLERYRRKLEEYTEKLDVCGERGSYSKTDHGATFMRVKRDYMGNDQLLPAYNVQLGIADEYIAVVDVQQYRSDMECFVPLIEKFHDYYGKYPKYPVADAGYGSFNNYLYCQEHGMEKYMKFYMYEKETKDRQYRNSPYNVKNFPVEADGSLICPDGRKMVLSRRQKVKGNNYGREEEIYVCEDCSNCPHSAKCRKGTGNRTVRVNRELTSIHEEVIDNLRSELGIELRTNRSIQAEGTFGVMKYDRWYKRTVRRGLKSVRLELLLVSIGYNLYKYYNKRRRREEEAA